MIKYIHLIIYLLAFSFSGISQDSEIEQNINWHPLINEENTSGNTHEYLYFDGAFTDVNSGLPLFTHSFPLSSINSNLNAEFKDAVYKPFDTKEQQYLSNTGFDKNEVQLQTMISVSKKMPSATISFIPIRLNAQTGMYEKLVSFNLSIKTEQISVQLKSSHRVYAENSVLSNGEWYKIKTQHSGIYKISYTDLESFGLDPSSIDPRHISIYGNAGGMLPEPNNDFRHDDIQENAIQVIGEDDGEFNESDYILFFGQSPHTWQDVLGFFTYQVNYYEDYNYYYLTILPEAGKRIEIEPSLAVTPSHQISKYNNYKVIEDEEINLILSGKKWYGDEFGQIYSRTYQFDFPHIITSYDMIIKTEIANRTFINEKMVIRINDEQNDTIILTSVNPNSTKFAQKKKKTVTYTPNSPELNVDLEYLPGTDASSAWLDYIMVNAICSLKFDTGQLPFRELSTILDGAITEFAIYNANQQLQVWEVTNPINPKLLDRNFLLIL